jgi:chorismate dehydratase
VNAVKKLRTGAVSYLNTLPLISHLPSLAPDVELYLAVPSRLATDLAAGALDIGLIPSIEYFRAGRYAILPEVAIASFGPVLSVKLCSRKPFAAIDTLALDEGSRTSIALAKLLLGHLFDVQPETTPLPLESDPRRAEGDAVLAIGDRAMRIPGDAFPFTLDLGYEWTRWTGMPFVWAFWAVRDGVVVPPETAAAFVRAKELGRPEIPRLAAAHAERLGLDAAQCQYYLQRAIRHDFGAAELAGLEHFYALAAAAGLAPEGVACVFHGARELVQSR